MRWRKYKLANSIVMYLSLPHDFVSPNFLSLRNQYSGPLLVNTRTKFVSRLPMAENRDWFLSLDVEKPIHRASNARVRAA